MKLPDSEHRELGSKALELALSYVQEIENTPIVPQISGAQVSREIEEPLPEQGQSGLDTLEQYRTRIQPYCRNNGHPGMLGYVSSSATWAGAIADLLASAINQNVTSWRSAPGPATVERLVICWIAEMLGYPTGCGGLLLSGGSMANFSALHVALNAKAGIDLSRDGVRALKKAPAFYASELVHHSVAKGLGLLGVGSGALRVVPKTSQFTLDIAALEGLILKDFADGLQPMCVVANAGDVNTGNVDDLQSIAAMCRKYSLWLHVDGAYGGFAALAPSAKSLFAAIDRADSVSLDPHKWLFTPIDAGCLLVKKPELLKAAFSHTAEYIKILNRDPAETYAFWDHGPELSRRFRALKIWFTLKYHGTQAISAAIENNIHITREFAQLIEQAPDFELLSPTTLSIACFRYLPQEARGKNSETDLALQVDQLNQSILEKLHKSGEFYPSNALIDGKFALRICVVNFRTEINHLKKLLERIRELARE